MPPTQQNPYDFIMSPTQKKRGIGLNGGSQKTRIMQVAVIALIIFVVGGGLLMFINSKKSSSTDTYLSLAASQQDIIDITKLGATNVRDQQLLMKNASVSLLLVSQNTQTITLIKSLGTKNPVKQIAALQIKTYTKTLSDAKKNGNYDSVYEALLANRLDEYRVKLQAAYANATADKTKKQLSEDYQQLEIIYPASTQSN